MSEALYIPTLSGGVQGMSNQLAILPKAREPLLDYIGGLKALAVITPGVDFGMIDSATESENLLKAGILPDTLAKKNSSDPVSKFPRTPKKRAPQNGIFNPKHTL
jgi:hypothetical protein